MARVATRTPTSSEPRAQAALERPVAPKLDESMRPRRCRLQTRDQPRLRRGRREPTPRVRGEQAPRSWPHGCARAPGRVAAARRLRPRSRQTAAPRAAPRAGRGRGTPRGRTGCRRAPHGARSRGCSRLWRAPQCGPRGSWPGRAPASRPRTGRGAAQPARGSHAPVAGSARGGDGRARRTAQAERATGTIRTLSGIGAGVEVVAVPTGDRSVPAR